MNQAAMSQMMRDTYIGRWPSFDACLVELEQRIREGARQAGYHEETYRFGLAGHGERYTCSCDETVTVGEPLTMMKPPSVIPLMDTVIRHGMGEAGFVVHTGILDLRRIGDIREWLVRVHAYEQRRKSGNDAVPAMR